MKKDSGWCLDATPARQIEITRALPLYLYASLHASPRRNTKRYLHFCTAACPPTDMVPISRCNSIFYSGGRGAIRRRTSHIRLVNSSLATAATAATSATSPPQISLAPIWSRFLAKPSFLPSRHTKQVNGGLLYRLLLLFFFFHLSRVVFSNKSVRGEFIGTTYLHFCPALHLVFLISCRVLAPTKDISARSHSHAPPSPPPPPPPPPESTLLSAADRRLVSIVRTEYSIHHLPFDSLLTLPAFFPPSPSQGPHRQCCSPSASSAAEMPASQPSKNLGDLSATDFPSIRGSEQGGLGRQLVHAGIPHLQISAKSSVFF
ncbi:hypothetical protein IF2G_08906 [Cordyceps javanica]|nr:hypothetical protein IF2G_08906 [Cordyceps javanica]